MIRKRDLISEIANPAISAEGSLEALVRRFLSWEDSQQASNILSRALSRADESGPVPSELGIWPLAPS